MIRIVGIAALALGLALTPIGQGQRQQDAAREACFQRCATEPALGDPEVQRQEIVSLEKEAARAIQQNSATFFYRIYSDDFAGTLSHGQQINKLQGIEAVESPLVKRESFYISDIKVRIFPDTAVATCLWSSRFIVNHQPFSTPIP